MARINSDVDLEGYAQSQIDAGIPFDQSVDGLSPEDVRYFRKVYEDLSTPKGHLQAIGKGMGKIYDWTKTEAPYLPANLLQGAFTMLDNATENLPQKVGEAAKTGFDLFSGRALMPNSEDGQPLSTGEFMTEMGHRATLGLTDEQSLIRQLIDEQVATPSEEMTRLMLDLQEARDAEESPDVIRRIERNLEIATEDFKPLSAVIGRAVNDIIGYWFDRDSRLRMIAEQPMQVWSDVATTIGAAVSAVSGGITMTALAKTDKGKKTIEMLAKLKNITEKGYVDPMMIPQHLVKKGQQFDEWRRVGPDVGMTNQRNELRPRTQFGKDESGNALITNLSPVEAADEFGAGAREGTPAYMLNPAETMEAWEFNSLKKPGAPTQRAQNRMQETAVAIQQTKQKMINDLIKGDNPYEPLEAGKRILQMYNDRHMDDFFDVEGMFKSANANFGAKVRPDFNLGQKFQKIIDKRLDDDVIDDDVRAATTILKNLLTEIKEQGRDVNTTTLRSIQRLRTNFRKRLSTFGAQEFRKIGANTAPMGVYDEITELFYEAIEDTVQKSGGEMPASLASDVRAGMKQWRDIIQLEQSPAGKFLESNKDTPANIVKGLVRPTGLDSDQIVNLYKLIDDKGDMRAAILNEIFNQSSKGALGLKNQIAKINQTDSNRLIALFGGGDEGKEIAKKLSEFADFWASSAPTGRLRSGSPTALALRHDEMMGTGAIDDIAQLVYLARGWKDPVGWLVALSMAINFIGGKLKYTEYQRIRMLYGHDLPEWADKAGQAMLKGTQRKVVKPAELINRGATGAKEQQEIQGLDKDFLQNYVQRGGGTTRRE